jgi:hypothetical protein
MSQQDRIDAGPTLDRLGKLLQRIGDAGWPDLHGALAGYVRERRGRVTATHLPFGPAKDLMNLVPELERLADILESPEVDDGPRD